jgi:hypothetical protein
VTRKNGVFWTVTPCSSCKNVSEELSASFIRLTRIGELGQVALFVVYRFLTPL